MPFKSGWRDSSRILTSKIISLLIKTTDGRSIVADCFSYQWRLEVRIRQEQGSGVVQQQCAGGLDGTLWVVMPPSGLPRHSCLIVGIGGVQLVHRNALARTIWAEVSIARYSSVAFSCLATRSSYVGNVDRSVPLESAASAGDSEYCGEPRCHRAFGIAEAAHGYPRKVNFSCHGFRFREKVAICTMRWGVSECLIRDSNLTVLESISQFTGMASEGRSTRESVYAALSLMI